jgi:hypothetical protein
MENFISIILDNRVLEESISEMLNVLSDNKLIESIIDYEIFETADKKYVLRVYTPFGLSEDESDEYVDMLAERLYARGHNDFEVEISMNQASITENDNSQVHRTDNVGVLDYDVVEDLLVFMRNDPIFYRKHLYPMLLDIQQKLQSGAKYNKKDMLPVLDRAVNMYVSAYNINVEPNKLLKTSDKRDCINRLLKDEIKNFKKGIY